MKLESLKSSKFESFMSNAIGQHVTQSVVGSKLVETTYYMGGVTGKDTNNTDTHEGPWHDSSGTGYDIYTQKFVIPLGGNTLSNQISQAQSGVRLSSEKELALHAGIQQMSAIMREVANFQ